MTNITEPYDDQYVRIRTIGGQRKRTIGGQSDAQWQPRRGKRSRGRPSRRWEDDITEKEGTTWIRKATDRQWKTLMEGYILQWMDKT